MNNNKVNLNTLNVAIQDLYNNINTMFLAKVETYDHITSTCSVQPLEKQTDYFGNYIDPAIILEVPVMLQKTGGFYMRFPYLVGDVVLVGVSQTAMDDLIITGTTEINTLSEQGRKFDVNDAVLLGGIFTEQESQMSETNSDDLLIMNRTNGSKIAFQSDGTVNVENGTSITISPTGDVTVVAPTSINYTSPITTFNGNVAINGTLTGTSGSVSMSVDGSGMSVTGGEISTDTDVKAGSISLTTHKHNTTVTSGSSSGTYISEGAL